MSERRRNQYTGVQILSPSEVAEIFWEHVQKTETCWLYTTKVGTPLYGKFHANGITRPATHVAWELHHGKPFPKGLQACHHCDNPRCVNPTHLFPGTVKDNIRDSVKKGRHHRSGWQACGRGHPYTPENTIVRADGSHICRVCRRDWNERRRSAAIRREN